MVPFSLPARGESIFGAINLLQPRDVRQFLYHFPPLPKPSSSGGCSVATAGQSANLKGQSSGTFASDEAGLHVSQLPGQPTALGRLDITWRSTMGERGRLQTSTLKHV
ncbi:unnamed protein product, partial [Protopolystoma xenopodis]